MMMTMIYLRLMEIYQRTKSLIENRLKISEQLARFLRIAEQLTREMNILEVGRYSS